MYDCNIHLCTISRDNTTVRCDWPQQSRDIDAGSPLARANNSKEETPKCFKLRKNEIL